MIIQRIPMHEIQVYRTRERLVELIRTRSRHIVFIELGDLKLRFHRFLVPFEIVAVHTVSLDEQCADRREDHRFLIHVIGKDKHLVQMFVEHLHLACQIGCIQCQFLCHQLIFYREQQDPHLKHPQLFQGRALLPETAERLQIKPDTVGAFLIELLFQSPEPFAVDFIFRVHFHQHAEDSPAVRMFHERP